MTTLYRLAALSQSDFLPGILSNADRDYPLLHGA